MKKRWIFVPLLLMLLVIGCQKEKPSLIVGASSFPHAEILYAAKPYLEEKGYQLEIVEYPDYIMPNLDLEAKVLDANYFQHQPYLDNFNEINNTNLVSVAKIHYEPLGLYAGKINSLEALKAKSRTSLVKIAIPSDMTNAARALLLLESQGLVKLKEDIGLKATLDDIVDKSYYLKIDLIEPSQINTELVDYDAAVINGNYAIQHDISDELILAKEEADSLAAQTYANVLVVNAGNEDREDIQALIKVLKSPELKAHINAIYEGTVLSIN